MISLALAGKPNTGKSTFFQASTLMDVPIASYPFTTKDANYGIAYVRSKCPCRELGVEKSCNSCISGERFTPVELIDVAGLVPDAHLGRGLGNAFLDHLRRADAIIHVVDASGSTDSEGNIVEPSSHDPASDILMLEKEFSWWLYGILERKWRLLSKRAVSEKTKIERVVAQHLAGIGVSEAHVHRAISSSGLDGSPERWKKEELLLLSNEIRKESKPIIIAANKVDLAPKENLEKLRKAGYPMVECCAEAELALRKASKNKLVKYLPGDYSFRVESGVTKRQADALEKIKVLLHEFGGTGIQRCINSAVFDLLGSFVVYPVEDENRYCDSKGNTLPDSILLRQGATPPDLAGAVHSDLEKGFLFAVDARTKRRLGEKYELKPDDVIRIVSSR
jgi:hypothetical protein